VTADIQLIFATAHQQLRPRKPLPKIEIEFFPFAGINHTVRLRDNRLIVRLSDLVTNAPPDIYSSLALILLAKLYRKTIDHSHHRAYRTFILTAEIQERARIARTRRGRGMRAGNARGRHVDLESLFDRLNQEYFDALLVKPVLSWSPKKSRHVLGRYDATHNVIFISRFFDVPAIPWYVTAYILFHEMLHLKHHACVRDSRMIVHTREFKAEEKRFRQYEEARRWLKTL
jgi:predicted metal-dependent hydrolase